MWLGKTRLSDKSKSILFEDAVKIYQIIKDDSLKQPQKKKNCVAALRLACNQNSCAIGGVILKSKSKYLSSARQKTGLFHIEAIDRVNAIVNILKADEEIKEKAT
ncbi:MAG: hypothetical protein K0B02_04260 [DPANN group archaeon]|nr:hypothetical protein [DPANN group archaeon]